MQVDTPIIATKIGEIETMVGRPGSVAGILIENDSNNDNFVNSLKGAMNLMLEESARTDFAMASKRNSSEYDMDTITDRYCSLYERLIMKETAA